MSPSRVGQREDLSLLAYDPEQFSKRPAHHRISACVAFGPCRREELFPGIRVDTTQNGSRHSRKLRCAVLRAMQRDRALRQDRSGLARFSRSQRFTVDGKAGNSFKQLQDGQPRTAMDGTESASPVDGSPASKRKNDDPDQPRRAKRNRYISIAWYVPRIENGHDAVELTNSQQRVQAAQDQMQWADSVPEMRQS
jgi:hypothetical protein